MRCIADKISPIKHQTRQNTSAPVDLGACTHITPLSAVAVVLGALTVAASDLPSIDLAR